MKADKVKGTITTAYGKTLKEHGLSVSALPFEFSYDKLDEKNGDDIAAARSEFKTEKDLNEAIVGLVNDRRKAKARAEKQEEVLKENGIEKPKREEPEQVYKAMLAQYRLLKMDEEQAKTLVLNAIRMTYPDFTPAAE